MGARKLHRRDGPGGQKERSSPPEAFSTGTLDILEGRPQTREPFHFGPSSPSPHSARIHHSHARTYACTHTNTKLLSQKHPAA